MATETEVPPAARRVLSYDKCRQDVGSQKWVRLQQSNLVLARIAVSFERHFLASTLSRRRGAGGRCRRYRHVGAHKRLVIVVKRGGYLPSLKLRPNSVMERDKAGSGTQKRPKLRVKEGT